MGSLSSILGSNVLSESESAQQKAYVTYAFPRRNADDSIVNDNSVTLLESRSVISSSGTTGLRTWEAALLLGQFLSSDRGSAMVREKRVFELGAGTGMLSILCAKHLGVSGIVSTDGDEAVVDAIKTNVFLNELDASRTAVTTAALKWGRPLNNGSTFLEDYGVDIPDVLLGADVVRSLS
jgi:predicted nicotinamide N-methyase